MEQFGQAVSWRQEVSEIVGNDAWDEPQDETTQDALDSQKRWLEIAALEPDPERRAQALTMANRYGERATQLAGDALASQRPEEFTVLSARVMAAAQSSWRKHPIRRLNVERQRIQLALGEWMVGASLCPVVAGSGVLQLRGPA